METGMDQKPKKRPALGFGGLVVAVCAVSLMTVHAIVGGVGVYFVAWAALTTLGYSGLSPFTTHELAYLLGACGAGYFFWFTSRVFVAKSSQAEPPNDGPT
jgi:hypothetical protein